MGALASGEDRPAASARRRFQFSLKTLLIVVTLSAVLCAVAAWWITLPLRTWSQFVARVNAGDLDAINALCDQETIRVVAEHREPPESDPGEITFAGEPSAQKPTKPRVVQKEVPEFTLSRLKELVSESPDPLPRTFEDVLIGRLQLTGYLGLGRLEVRRSKVASLRPPVPW